MKRFLIAAALGSVAVRWFYQQRVGFYMVGTVDPDDLPPGRWTPVYGKPADVVLCSGLERAICRLASAIQERS